MIGPVVEAALHIFREQAESLMTDTCTIARLTTTWDEEDQQSVTTWATIHADVPCHLDEPSANTRTLVTGDVVTLENPLVKVPWSISGVQPDDRVTVTGRPPMWVTRAAHDDSTHPVEYLIQCRWSR